MNAIRVAGDIILDNKSKIVIKINLCDARPFETGAITHPMFLEALLKYIRTEKDEDIEILVIEGDSGAVLADQFIKWFGFTPVLNRWKATWVNITKINSVEKEINGYFFKKIRIPNIFDDSTYFISLAKLKTNIVTKITCSLKNQFGCLPIIYKARLHKHVDDVIADINSVIKPNFSIIDGIIGQGGAQGPAFGIPLPAGLIIAGRDPVAVDATCSKIFGFNPLSIGHIRKSWKRGLGTIYSLNTVLITEEGNKYRNRIPKVNAHWSRLEEIIMKIGIKMQERSS